jgi:uncharacterized protein
MEGEKGLVISGRFSEILVREKADSKIEIGEMLVSEGNGEKTIMQVYDLSFGSQISQQNLELISGMRLEDSNELSFIDEKLRNYNLALMKSLVTIRDGRVMSSKSLPKFFSPVREVKKDDFSFIAKPDNALFCGTLRSGSKPLDLDIFLPGEDVFSHHILIPATTGRGKSNLASVMLWDSMSRDYCGILVLDPHDEYYGRSRLGLKDHPRKEKLVYYTPNSPPPGARTLRLNLKDIRPKHFNGASPWSDPQREALYAYYNRYRESWIEAIIKGQELHVAFSEGTLAVVKRRLLSLLDLDFFDNKIISKGIFDQQSGQTTVSDICDELEKGRVVIIDTSSFSGAVEILIGSIITSELFSRYKSYKYDGTLPEKPVISVFLEEAPRVLGKEVLEEGPNIFATIAREGRKFRVGLTAITQLPSSIPREILANMNTKIILGIEMQHERQAIIDSASQDLSSDARAIASLDRGEAIITSNFTRFAIPVKIPLFRDFAEKGKAAARYQRNFEGIA